MIPTELRLKLAPQRGQEAAVAAMIPPHARHEVIRLIILFPPRNRPSSLDEDNSVTNSDGCRP
jgi:hypothetical protein